MNFNMNPNSELVQSAVNVPNLVPVPDALISQAREFQMAMMNLDDIAGIRVVCSFVDDIYAVANMLVSQDDITVITIKDYIKHPKPNGYRSYHLIIEIPVFFSEEKKNLRVEVQIRTIAMDFWASLDHQLKYKKDIGDVSDQISEELRQCAETIAATDQRMLNIRRSIESQGAFSDKYGKALSPILET